MAIRWMPMLSGCSGFRRAERQSALMLPKQTSVSMFVVVECLEESDALLPFPALGLQ